MLCSGQIADKDKSAAEIVTSINRTLSLNNDSNMFVTFFTGILDTTTGKLNYCNAGHNPPVLISGGKSADYFQFFERYSCRIVWRLWIFERVHIYWIRWSAFHVHGWCKFGEWTIWQWKIDKMLSEIIQPWGIKTTYWKLLMMILPSMWTGICNRMIWQC